MSKSKKLITMIASISMALVFTICGFLIGRVDPAKSANAASEGLDVVQAVSAPEPQSLETLLVKESNYRIYLGSLDQLGAEIWMFPTYMVVEVPSEVWTDGTVKWQVIRLRWEYGSSTLFQHLYLNTSTGVAQVCTSRVTLVNIIGYTQLKYSSIGSAGGPTISMPAPNRVWAEQYN